MKQIILVFLACQIVYGWPELATQVQWEAMNNVPTNWVPLYGNSTYVYPYNYETEFSNLWISIQSICTVPYNLDSVTNLNMETVQLCLNDLESSISLVNSCDSWDCRYTNIINRSNIRRKFRETYKGLKGPFRFIGSWSIPIDPDDSSLQKYINELRRHNDNAYFQSILAGYVNRFDRDIHRYVRENLRNNNDNTWKLSIIQNIVQAAGLREEEKQELLDEANLEN